MSFPTPIPRAQSSVATDREERIRHLPAAAREAFRRFEALGDRVALDMVILAILEDFAPRPPAAPLATSPGATRLIEDLGFDSLAITEVVFFIEDLFGISISNQEIVLVRTLDDLRSFVRQKIPAPGASR
ncbi:MAG: acyl carrier protein [Verrucomicrobia bacterium]|nr:acyl carrier protein [Verrucomicrobiota bacterium]